MRKKILWSFCALLSAVCMSVGALAAETYADIRALYEHWSMNGMPDWVCSVVSADGHSERLAVVVNSQTAAEQLAAMVKDASSMDVIVSDGGYGYNALLQVQEEISREYMRGDGKSPVVRIATGLALIDGNVVGFGESGKELRVVVSVLEESAEEYRALFRKRYGDMVYVEAAEQAVLTDMDLREPAKTVSYAWYWGGAAAVLCVMAAVWLRHRKMKAHAAENTEE